MQLYDRVAVDTVGRRTGHNFLAVRIVISLVAKLQRPLRSNLPQFAWHSAVADAAAVRADSRVAAEIVSGEAVFMGPEPEDGTSRKCREFGQLFRRLVIFKVER